MSAVRPNFGGPVSAALEADVRGWIRKQGIVVWLDQHGHYTEFVDRLAVLGAGGALPYAVYAFRGSHLALMRALEGVAAGTERMPVVIHMPGFTEESVKQTPLFELYAAGTRYRKALDTLVNDAAAGRVKPEQIAAFRAHREPTLAAADAWLAERLKLAEGGLAAHLLTMTPAAVLDDVLSDGFVAKRLGGASEAGSPPADGDETAFWDRLNAWLGLPPAWQALALPASRPHSKDIAFAVASWAMCVEYVDDLRRPPVNALLVAVPALPRAVIEACRALAVHLRDRHAGFYRSAADATEALLADEVEATRAEDLGSVDTFRFEEDTVLAAAFAAIENGEFAQAADWAGRRVEPEAAVSASFWLRDNPARMSAWQLLRDAARLGQAITRAGARLSLGAATGLDDAVAAYVERGAAVDQAHRQLEQRRLALLYPQLPEFETLRARLDAMRRHWRTWADAWARDFNALCRAHGFVGAASSQQRTLFDEVVRPLTQEAGTTAYFVVDALRYEMGEALHRQLQDTSSTTAHLKARLAELPTVTEVGMNALAPVHKQGRLHVAMAGDTGPVLGFQTGEFRVFDPETRKRAMHDRVGGATCPWLTLEDVVGRDVPTLKRTVAQARLVVVHSQEIDAAGENGAGPAMFDVVMQKLRAAWRLLRDAGVRRFVFTSDHGFLLLDDSAASAVAHGRRIDPKRRHVFSPVGADHKGEARVALAELGYEGANGHVMFPETTAVFDTGRRTMSFVHGGNSLQERVIPVLTLIHRAAAGASDAQYGVSAAACEGVAGMHCIEARIEALAQQTLDYSGAREIELALRVHDAPPSSDIGVEICQTRGKARLAGGVIAATVGERFEVFFRLSGSVDARVLVELHHPSAAANVTPAITAERFVVSATRAGQLAPAPTTPASSPSIGVGVGVGTSWLEQISEPGVRQVFAHLSAHGAVTESEAAAMLGGARGLRRFAFEFEAFARKAPFAVRIDVVAGVKRYVREGAG